MGNAAGWDRIYSSRAPEGLGWHEDVPSTLPEVLAAAPSPNCSVIDVGAGVSSLVEHLLEHGFADITLLDISERALKNVADRLDRPVETIVADVRSFHGDRQWDLWHDRATFHFLTTEQDRRRYVEAVDRSLTPEGRVVIAVFGTDGPQQCAGRPVERYDAATLVEAFGDRFECVDHRDHRPGPGRGDRRPYVVATLRRSPSARAEWTEVPVCRSTH